jgi:hypothetical protein
MKFVKDRSEKAVLVLGRKLKYIYTCTITLYDILNVKNALLKPIYHSTECVIFNLVTTDMECVYCAVWTEYLYAIQDRHAF